MQRFSLVIAACALFCLTLPAAAQTGRAMGVVRDTGGKPIKGATIRAVNREAYPPEFTATTDDKGRWAMIGLRGGTWTFFVEAPGYLPIQAPSNVRSAPTPPLTITLARDPGPVPNALDRNIQQQLAAANSLRERGQFDQAITAYQQIRAQNPTLTNVNLVVAGVYRRQAAQASDPNARRALLERAIASYTELLSSDAGNERAKIELESTRAEAAALPR
jgi:hypothetical protein